MIVIPARRDWRSSCPYPRTDYQHLWLQHNFTVWPIDGKLNSKVYFEVKEYLEYTSAENSWWLVSEVWVEHFKVQGSVRLVPFPCYSNCKALEKVKMLPLLLGLVVGFFSFLFFSIQVKVYNQILRFVVLCFSQFTVLWVSSKRNIII